MDGGLPFFGFEIVERDAGEIGDDDVARAFFRPSFARKVLDVSERLRFRAAEVLAEALVFDEHLAGPEQIDVTVVAGNFLHRLFKARHGAAADAEDVEELVPEGLLFRPLALRAGPFF
jgi:hypothetical protein